MTDAAAGTVAVLAVRGGELPTGALECVAEANGAAVVVGDGLDEAIAALGALAAEVWALEWPGRWSPHAIAAAVADLLSSTEVVLTPATPDGRDLAPHLALVLGRALYAGAISVGSHRVVEHGHGGRSQLTSSPPGPFLEREK